MDSRFIAITRKYEETFAETMKELSKEKEENIIAIGIVTLCADGYYTYYGNANLMDKHTMASVLQCDVMREEQQEDIIEVVADTMKLQASGAILEGIKAVLDVMGVEYDESDLTEAGEKLKHKLEGTDEDESES